MISEYSLRAARRLLDMDSELPDKVEYLLATRGLPSRREQLSSTEIALAVASLIVSAVGVVVQIAESLRARSAERRQADLVEQRLMEIVGRPAFLSQVQYVRIIQVVVTEVMSVDAPPVEKQ